MPGVAINDIIVNTNTSGPIPSVLANARWSFCDPKEEHKSRNSNEPEFRTKCLVDSLCSGGVRISTAGAFHSNGVFVGFYGARKKCVRKYDVHFGLKITSLNGTLPSHRSKFRVFMCFVDRLKTFRTQTDCSVVAQAFPDPGWSADRWWGLPKGMYKIYLFWRCLKFVCNG